MSSTATGDEMDHFDLLMELHGFTDWSLTKQQLDDGKRFTISAHSSRGQICISGKTAQEAKDAVTLWLESGCTPYTGALGSASLSA